MKLCHPALKALLLGLVELSHNHMLGWKLQIQTTDPHKPSATCLGQQVSQGYSRTEQEPYHPAVDFQNPWAVSGEASGGLNARMEGPCLHTLLANCFQNRESDFLLKAITCLTTMALKKLPQRYGNTNTTSRRVYCRRHWWVTGAIRSH